MTNKNEETPIRKPRFIMYICMALIVAGVALYVLAQEPDLGCPINLIHLLFKH